MDTQTIIDSAITASATTVAAAEAATIFRGLKSDLRVNVNLTVTQRNELQNTNLSIPVSFTGGYSVTNDHPTLIAIRDLARDIMEREFHISDASERVLIVGAAAREIKKYNAK